MIRVSLGEYKKLKAEVAAAKREALNWQLMYQDTIDDYDKLEAEIKRRDAENKRLKLRD